MSVQDPVVTKLKVARLFNLGNYEHERIEVTVEARGYELQDGSVQQCDLLKPAETLQELRAAVEACKPVPFGYQEQQGRDIELGLITVWDGNGEEPSGPYVGSEIAKEYAEAWKRYQETNAKRKLAFARLNKLGTVTEGGAV